VVIKVAIFLDDKNYRMIDDEEIIDELGDDDAVIGDEEEEEGLGGDGLPKVPGEGLEEEGDLL
jgi:hypothetical protein